MGVTKHGSCAATGPQKEKKKHTIIKNRPRRAKGCLRIYQHNVLLPNDVQAETYVSISAGSRARKRQCSHAQQLRASSEAHIFFVFGRRYRPCRIPERQADTRLTVPVNITKQIPKHCFSLSIYCTTLSNIRGQSRSRLRGCSTSTQSHTNLACVSVWLQ